MDRIRYLELRLLAEKKLGCDKERLSYEYLGNKAHLLAGCGREARFLIFKLGDRWVKVVSFHERASFDLECNARKLTTDHLGDNTWLASGCDRSAVYILKCEEYSRQCEWLAGKKQVDTTINNEL